MDGLSMKDIVGVVLGVLFLGMIVFLRGGARPRMPKDRFFHCWRCKALTAHNGRTIQAWRNEKTRFFCGACHTTWLQSHPAPVVQVKQPSEYGPRRKSSASGTVIGLAAMGVIALLARSCA
jgi:hypothetical protein